MVLAYLELGAAVNHVFENGGFSINFLKDYLASPMGLSPLSITEYVGGYKSGSIYGSKSGNPQDKKGRLDKTSVFLYALGFSEDSEIIAGIMKRDSRFEYPPPEEKRVSYDYIKKEFESTKSESINERDKQLALEYPELGIVVTKRFEESGVSRKFWAKELSPFLNMPNKTIEQFIGRWKQGYLYAIEPPKDPDIQLRRLEGLAVFLYSLDFSEDDEIIAGVRKMDERFPYPPPEEKRISCEQIIEEFEAFREEIRPFAWR